MKIFLLVMSLFFILLSTYGFYYSSEKQCKKILNSPLKYFSKNTKRTKIISSLFFILALILLTYVYGLSIAFLSIWIFTTPILAIFILFKNDLKPKIKN
ncbi:hypothetical protein A6M14_04005 [Acinetobacter sp. Ac_877]|nr:hypothetical protein [Acinetobacter portensis]